MSEITRREETLRKRFNILEKQFEMTSMLLEKYLEEDEPRRQIHAPYPHRKIESELKLLEGMVVDMQTKLMHLRRARKKEGMN
tara:strand:+ start:81 stop:329 length:249 start_codon:yes stop_codon:yes gene_type:complete